MVRVEIILSGQVQGVGFRYTARSMAQQLGAVGWVRNLSDGRVQMLIEGAESVVTELIERLEKQFSISDKKISQGAVLGDIKDFTIAF